MADMNYYILLVIHFLFLEEQRDRILIHLVFVFQKSMEEHVNECYDSIAIFLCIHIVHRFRTIMASRAVPALERLVENIQ